MPLRMTKVLLHITKNANERVHWELSAAGWYAILWREMPWLVSSTEVDTNPYMDTQLSAQFHHTRYRRRHHRLLYANPTGIVLLGGGGTWCQVWPLFSVLWAINLYDFWRVKVCQFRANTRLMQLNEIVYFYSRLETCLRACELVDINIKCSLLPSVQSWALYFVSGDWPSNPLWRSGTSSPYLAQMLCFFCGTLITFMGFAKLGFLINYISGSVLRGFLNAQGFALPVSQLPALFGVKSRI